MKRKLHTQLDRIFPSVADRVRSKQCKQKAVHDYQAKERTLEEDQAVHAKDFRYEKTWLRHGFGGKDRSSVSSNPVGRWYSHSTTSRPCSCP